MANILFSSTCGRRITVQDSNVLDRHHHHPSMRPPKRHNKSKSNGVIKRPNTCQLRCQLLVGEMVVALICWVRDSFCSSRDQLALGPSTLTALQIGSTVKQFLEIGESIVHCIALKHIRTQCFSAPSSDLPLVSCQLLSFDYAVLSIINEALKIQKLDAKHMSLPLSSWIFKRPGRACAVACL